MEQSLKILNSRLENLCKEYDELEDRETIFDFTANNLSTRISEVQGLIREIQSVIIKNI